MASYNALVHLFLELSPCDVRKSPVEVQQDCVPDIVEDRFLGIVHCAIFDVLNEKVTTIAVPGHLMPTSLQDA